MCPRETMRVLPIWLQPFLTWMTGKPYDGQRPLIGATLWTEVLSAYVTLFLPAYVIHWALFYSPCTWIIIPACWIFIAGAARKIQVTLVHQCVHYAFTGSKKLDRFLGNLMGISVLIDRFEGYFHEHILIHHTNKAGTSNDPDCASLLALGFLPGMSQKALWNKLLKTIISPHFHLQFMWTRLKANFVSAPLYRKVSALVLHMMVLLWIYYFDLWLTLGLAWLFPIFFVYQVSSLLNRCSLHFWMRQRTPNETAMKHLASLSHGRFSGEEFPALYGVNKAKKLSLITRWILRMIFLHLPARIGVLCGDLTVHDFHHRHPKIKNWPNYIYDRQLDIEMGLPGWDVPYIDTWGLIPSIDKVFAHFSTLNSKAQEQGHNVV